MTRFTHSELTRAGLTVIGGEVVRLDQPDESWEVEALLAYAKGEMAEAVSLAKRTTVHYYRAGHALSLIRDKLKPLGEWCRWQGERGLSRTTVNDAIRIYEGAGSEAACADLPVMDAFRKFGIAKRPQVVTQGSTEVRKSARRAADGPGAERHDGDRPTRMEKAPATRAQGAVQPGAAPLAPDTEYGPLTKVGQVVVVLSALRASVEWASADLAAWQAALDDLAEEVEALRKEVASASV